MRLCGQCDFPTLCEFCINGELTPEGKEEEKRLILLRQPQMANESCRS
jgi:hypothetical protein